MAGIYIHVPFCRSRCIYCDFFSTEGIEDKIDAYCASVCHEIILRAPLLQEKNNVVNTIYFGGGTPSLLTVWQIESILSCIKKHYNVSEKAEITLEGNPDDITADYSKDIVQLGINRISLGVQSFNDQDLKLLRRRHTSHQVYKSVLHLQDAGIENISLDLIYGLPKECSNSLSANLKAITTLGIQHISAYSLIYEEATPLWNMLQKKSITPKSDDAVANEYREVIHTLADAGYKQYEVSNFARNGYHSKHNSSYWNRTPYLGFGPAAHSYLKDIKKDNITLLPTCSEDISNREIRFYNSASLTHYCSNKSKEIPFGEIEVLSETDVYNEWIMLGLRTIKGISLEEFTNHFGSKYTEKLLNKSQTFIDQGILSYTNNTLSATEKGLFLIDGVIRDLFI